MAFMDTRDLFLLEEIVRKNFSSKYKDSILGILWSVLHPLLMVIVITIVFSTMLGKGIDNYPVYLISGRCLFFFFTGAIGSSMGVIKGNQNILKKTGAPKHIFVLGTIISEFIDFLIQFMLLIFIMLATNAPFHFSTMPFAIFPVVCTVFMVIGFSFIMSILATYYTDIKHLWGVIRQILMYASALYFVMENIPEPFYSYLILNPVFWAVNQFRCFMVFGTFPDLINMFNLLTFSLIVLVLGIIVFKKYEDRVILQL